MKAKDQILNLLQKESGLTAFEIASKTGLVMKTVSNEANTLFKTGILSKVKDGNRVRFSLIKKTESIDLPEIVETKKEEKNVVDIKTENDLDKIKEKVVSKRETKKRAEKKDPAEKATPRPGSLSEKIAAYLIANPDEKIYAVAKKFESSYAFTRYVKNKFC